MVHISENRNLNGKSVSICDYSHFMLKIVVFKKNLKSLIYLEICIQMAKGFDL